MIDFHTHVLPGIDDGSHSLEESMEMVRLEYEQGIRTIIATPHFYAHKVSINGFLERRQRAYEALMGQIAREERAPALLRSAEVYYFPGISKAEQLPALTVEGTDILLLEMPFAQWTSSVYHEVRDIIRDRHLTVLLVHLERFLQYQKDKSAWEDVLELPIYIQLNAGSFLEWRSRRTDKKLLGLGLPTVLGSDCHNMHSRRPNLQEGREVILKRLGGQEKLDELDRTAETLLTEHRRRAGI